MIYHQYFFDFYDNLPDISILIHSQQRLWHVESLLDQSSESSALYILSCTRRLCVADETSKPPLRTRGTALKMIHLVSDFQAKFLQAFRANFNIYDVPEILATPCCSQIAVTKERILSVPREQYQHHIDWLLKTSLPGNISGRTWGKPYFHIKLLFCLMGTKSLGVFSGARMIHLSSCLRSQESSGALRSFTLSLEFTVLIFQAEHMWQHLFLQKSIDCPIEHRAYCRLYHSKQSGNNLFVLWTEANHPSSPVFAITDPCFV
jgi:hypothetical protein